MKAADSTFPPGIVLGFIGAGILGTGLALALHQAGCTVSSVASRRFQSARALADRIPGCVPFPTAQEVADGADLVFVTTPDSAIETVAGDVGWRPGQYVVHCCGALGREALQAAERQGAETGAFHPFQTFAGLDEPALAARRLAGVTFAVSAEGDLESFSEGVGGQAGRPDGKHQRGTASLVPRLGRPRLRLPGNAAGGGRPGLAGGRIFGG